MVNPLDYDHVVVAFSGGKDSTAAFLHLLDRNVPKDRVELWHHDIDGREGSHLMDWPSTPAYYGAFARARRGWQFGMRAFKQHHAEAR